MKVTRTRWLFSSVMYIAIFFSWQPIAFFMSSTIWQGNSFPSFFYFHQRLILFFSSSLSFFSYVKPMAWYSDREKKNKREEESARETWSNFHVANRFDLNTQKDAAKEKARKGIPDAEHMVSISKAPNIRWLADPVVVAVGSSFFFKSFQWD